MANASEQVPEGHIPNPGLRPTFEAHAETHVGLVRKINEDSILDLADIGLWVVADGVGGADAGDRASQLIVASLRALTGPASAPKHAIGMPNQKYLPCAASAKTIKPAA